MWPHLDLAGNTTRCYSPSSDDLMESDIDPTLPGVDPLEELNLKSTTQLLSLQPYCFSNAAADRLVIIVDGPFTTAPRTSFNLHEVSSRTGRISYQTVPLNRKKNTSSRPRCAIRKARWRYQLIHLSTKVCLFNFEIITPRSAAARRKLNFCRGKSFNRYLFRSGERTSPISLQRLAVPDPEIRKTGAHHAGSTPPTDSDCSYREEIIILTLSF